MSKESKEIVLPQLLERLERIQALVGQCVEDLHVMTDGQPHSKENSSVQTLSRGQDLSFKSNERAFMKANVPNLSGPGKFVLILAYLAKGDKNREVPLKEAEKMWNRMTSIMGGKFNRKYSNIAKEKGWANTPKYGFYVLSDSWKACLSNK